MELTAKVNYFIHNAMNNAWIIPVCVLYIYIYPL